MTSRDLLAIVRDVWGSLATSVECGSDRSVVVVTGTISLTDVIQLIELIGVGIDQVDIFAISPGRSGVSIDAPNPQSVRAPSVRPVL